MKKRILAVLLCLTLVVTACSPGNKTPDPTTDPLIGLGEWDFNVAPLKSDGAGINVGTGFKVLSKNEVSAEYIKATVKIYPDTTFEVTESTGNEFILVPEQPLNDNTIYRVELTDPENGYNYKWAFQTQKDLKIIGSIPGRMSTYVPINTGIEVIFTHKNIENFSEVFSIEPAVVGTFTSNGYSMIFVPDKLERNTTYQVTVKAGAKVKDSDLALADDYVFTFTTESSGEEQLISINNLINTFTTAQTHFISAYVNRNAAKYEYDVAVYAFDSSDSFLKDIKQYDEAFAYLKMYENIADTVPAYLDLVESFKSVPVEVAYGYVNFHSFEMPKQLDPGYYLVRISYDNKDYFSYIQVNDMMVYDSQFEDNHFLWLLDSKDLKPVSNAKITINDQFTGTSKQDGIATISYTNDPEAFTTYAKIEADGFNDFVMRSVRRFDPYYRFYDDALRVPQFSETSNDYFKYIFTDRSTYLPTDTVNLYGYVKPKLKSGGQYKLSLYSMVNGVYLMDSKNITTTNTGTLTESFSWKDQSPGWYSILLEDGNDLVLRHEFYINEYTKPVYKVEGSFDKEFITAGESINYTIRSSFFDGGAVPDMPFVYYMYLGTPLEGKLTTDANGEADITLTPTFVTDNWRPIAASIEAYNRDAENYPITDYASFVFLPKERMVELEYDRDSDIPQVIIKGHELDSDKYKTGYDFSYEELRGAPLNLTAGLTVTASWYESRETGQVYDYINKVNRKTYESIFKSEVVEQRDIQLVNGTYVLQMPYAKDSDKSYEVTVSINDGKDGQILERTSFSYQRKTVADPFATYYSIQTVDNKYSYKINETINYYLDNDGQVEETDNDKMMVMYLQDGLLKYEIKDTVSGSFTFLERHIPNILVQAIYAKDGTMIKTAYPAYINYDYSEREIDIAVTANKKDYGPGEEVTLNIKTTDADGKPYPADINLSIVDEAYFSLYSQTADMLANIYMSVYSTGIISEYVSSENSGGFFRFGEGAEKGGDAADYYVRSEFKDTATFMTLTTNANGEGTITFKLPDNLTSWRITYQGVNDKMQASTGWININAKLPFHVSTILSKYFITGDNPSISLRVFGESAVKDKAVDYKVVLERKGSDTIKEIQKDGKIGQYTNISMGKLEKGEYVITSYATDGDYTDALQQSFEVVDSTVSFSNKKYYDITRSTRFGNVLSNAEVTFFVESKSNFYNSLLDLRFASGIRIDQLLAGMEARRFIKENFEPDLKLWDDAISRYQNYDGGIKLLPYGDSDTFISMRVALLNYDHFSQESLKTYFYNIINNSDSDLHSVVYAYTGLSLFKEPVLLDMYELLALEGLTDTHRISLALGLESIGDKTKATEIFKDVLSRTVKIGDKPVVSISDSNGENHVAAGLLATLAAKLGDFENGDLLFDYVYEVPSMYEIAYIEQLSYMKNRNIMDTEEIKALSGKVTVAYTGKEETIEIFGFETKTLTLSKEDLVGMTIKDVVSDIGAYVYALSGVEDLNENRVNEYSLVKQYSVGGQNQTTFKQSDLIKVTITPSVSDDRAYSYQITDFIPAGFRFIKADNNSGWYEQQEQKLIFYYWNSENHKTISYYMQAVMPGTYTADHVVITKVGHVGLNYTGQEVLTVND
ncbi:MAG: Ig-like domain-containing protein [Eubacteriales bacterium]|nr:Ig-like domain-containing protein [Eubacteriales bacterium]